MILQWLAAPEWARLVQALLHTLWQGALFAVLLGQVLRRTRDPAWRYRSALAALAAILLSGLITWAALMPAAAPRSDPASVPALTAAATVVPPAVSEQAPLVVQFTPPAAPAARLNWTAWLAFVWLAGAAAMLARAGVQVAGAERLRRSCRPLTDPRVTELFAEARRALGLARRVRLAVTDRLTSPAVAGVLIPTLILPLSLTTTLSPEQIRMVLLHELAHIRRGDYVANLFQLLAEALLFFNPAVWWISRQIRLEREACCDATAIALSGAPAEYAQTLLCVAESLLQPPPAAAPGFGGPRHSPLLDRVQRLLVPGYRPALRLTWRAMLLAMFTGGALLILCALGTQATLAAILSPQERIARIEKKMTENGENPNRPESFDNSHDPLPNVTVCGYAHTTDGTPVPKWVSMSILSTRERSSSGNFTYIKNGSFTNDSIPAGTIWLYADTEGFAPSSAGPFDGIVTNRLTGLDLPLNRGYDVPLQLCDADTGRPVTNARATTLFWMENQGFKPRSWKTGTNGFITLKHCADFQMTLTVNAPGYEIYQNRFTHVRAGEPLRVSLQRGAILAGVVLDKQTGRPVAGAEWHLRYLASWGQLQWDDPMFSLGRTDDRGAFVINQLRSGISYYLGLSVPGHESVMFEKITAGQNDMVVRVGPELVIHGRVLGGLDTLFQYGKDRVLEHLIAEKFNGVGNSMVENVPVTVQAGVARFTFTNRLAGVVTLKAGNGPAERTFERTVTGPVDDWVIDLTSNNIAAANVPIPKRTVIFRFRDAAGNSPQGTVQVLIPDNTDPAHPTARYADLVITNGQAQADFPVGSWTECNPKRTVGYWFTAWSCRTNVSNGPGPLILDVPVVPAGALYARAQNADGTPADGFYFSVAEVKRSPQRPEDFPLDNNDGVNNPSSGLHRWVSGPLPLGGTYRVTGWRGNTFCVSPPVKLTEAQPDAEVTLPVPAGQSFTGVVLNTNGQPVDGTSVNVGFMTGEHGFGLNAVLTDAHGRFQVDDTTPGIGTYSVTVSVPGCQAGSQDVNFSRLPVTFQLKPGRKLAGVVVEAATGLVIDHAPVRVWSENPKLPQQQVQTDENGRFEFTTLGDGTYHVTVDGGNFGMHFNDVFPAGRTNLLLRVTLYPGSELHPQAPATKATTAAASPQDGTARIGNKLTDPGQKTEPIPGATNQMFGGFRFGPRISISGRVRRADGTPVPETIGLRLVSQTGQYTTTYGGTALNGLFTNLISAGTFYVGVTATNFAPAVIGPIDGTGTNRLDNLEIVLPPGFVASLKLTDATTDRPVTNAAITATFLMGSAGLQTSSFQAGPDGNFILPRSADLPLDMTVNAPGYQLTRKHFDHVRAGEPLRLELVSGVVLDKLTGQPLAGAEVRLLFKPGWGLIDGADPIYRLGQTDANGAFTVTQLPPDARCFIGIGAKDHESVALGKMASSEPGLTVRLGPPLIVHGHIRGSLDSLIKVANRPVLDLAPTEELKDSDGNIGYTAFGSGWLNVEPGINGAAFMFTNPFAGPVTLWGGRQPFKRTITAPVDDWVIDLASNSVAVVTPPPAPNDNTAAPGLVTNLAPAVTGTNFRVFKISSPLNPDQLNEKLRAAGVEMPPTVPTYNEVSQLLLAQGTTEQLERVNTAVRAWNDANAPKLPGAGTSPAAQKYRPNPDPAFSVTTEKLHSLELKQFDSLAAVPLADALNRLHLASVQNDPENQGIDFAIAPAPPATDDLHSATVTIGHPFRAITLGEVVDAVVQGSSRPVGYSVNSHGTVWFAPAPASNPLGLTTREFKVDRFLFYDYVQGVVTVDKDVARCARQFFKLNGVNLDAPKSVFYNDKRNLLLVRATESELYKIETLLQFLGSGHAQIHLKARFVEIPADALAFPPLHPVGGTNHNAGLLTRTQAAAFLRQLESAPDAEILAEPEVTSFGGQQTQMKVTTLCDPDSGKPIPDHRTINLTNAVEIGPVLDSTPFILEDGYTIDLRAIATLVEFIGHGGSGQALATQTNGAARFRIQETLAHVHLWDGQTLVFSGFKDKYLTAQGNAVAAASTPPAPARRLVAIITVNLVDAAGNRVHTDAEMPFAKDAVPDQPAPEPGEDNLLRSPAPPTAVSNDTNAAASQALKKQNSIEPMTNTEVTTGHGVNQAPVIITTPLPDERKAQLLVQDGKLFYEMGKFDEAEKKLNTAFALEPDNALVQFGLNLVKQARDHGLAPQGNLFNHFSSLGRNPKFQKMERYQLASFGPFEQRPLAEVIKELAAEIGRQNPDKQGVALKMENPDGLTNDLQSVMVTIKYPFNDISLGVALGVIVLNASQPINFSLKSNDTILFQPVSSDTLFLSTRTFHVDTNCFSLGLKLLGTNAAAAEPADSAPIPTGGHGGIVWISGDGKDHSAPARQLFKSYGLDFKQPKALFYNDRLGLLMVRATEADLDKVEKVLQSINMVPPQIHLKARFLEVPAKGFIAPPLHPIGGTNLTAGILTCDETKTFLQSLHAKPDSQTLAEPEVTTVSGRQVSMKVTTIQSVVTGVTMTTNGPVPHTQPLETGPVLDASALVLADGYTVNLTASALVKRFSGYRKLSSLEATNGTDASLIGDLRAAATANLWDGQTLVVGQVEDSETRTTRDKVPVLGDVPVLGRLFQSQSRQTVENKLLILVTAEIVDPAGNRIHSDEEEPFAKNAVPEQPKF